MSKSSLASLIVPAHDSNFTYGRNGINIEKITIHHMAGVLTAQRCGEIFQKQGRNGSSHYGIGYDGIIANYVDENNIAWTDSNWDSNCKSVTIETSNISTGGDWNVSDETLMSLIKLVADIAKRNNLGTLIKGKNVTWHKMYCETTCPGNYLLSKMDYIIEEANKINNPIQEPIIEPKFYIGQKVIINGGLYINSNALNSEGYANNNVTTITRYARGSKHPYNTTDDLGWMNEESITPYVETTPEPIISSVEIGDKVLVTGRLYADSYGAGAGIYVENYKTTIALKVDTNRFAPYNIYNEYGEYFGWIKSDSIKKI